MFLLEGVEVTSDSNHNDQYVKDNNEVYKNEVCKGRRQDEETEPEITLYALVGSPTPGTMKVKGKVNSVSLVILVDSGSTHNFIDAAIVSVLHVPVDESQILEVKVANGDIIKLKDCAKMFIYVYKGRFFWFNYSCCLWEVVMWFLAHSGLAL